ncbi:glycosyltransferase [Desulfobacula toluolica]|uniref:Glycosyl transferase, family I n=1 Tax=Desulfobacula toluolica (strain DSM 7467 / Tol2) TaxID=651182 RepID=K0N952_DESTT|nr:glycosyltransferase [Desulfobacula toluolica]CCK80469.1 glycosyl transferase, family I [Desulfobacula toluolica Tol2]
MNVLFLSTRSPYPLISGHSLRTYHIMRGVAKRHNVTLVTHIQLDEELKSENIDHLKSICKAVYPYRIPADASRFKLVSALIKNLFSLKPFVAQKYDFPLMRRKIQEILKKGTIDLVHVDMLPLTAYEQEFSDIPKILVNHNVESLRLFRWCQNEKNILKKIYLGIQYIKLKAFERIAMRKFDCCVAVSEIDRNILQAMGGENKIVVVPNGTDTNFFKPLGRNKIEKSVLWIGHMDVHTNLDAVLYFMRDIYPVLKMKCPDVRIIFVGTSPPTEITEAEKKDKNIKTTGFVNDIRPYLDEAMVLMVPIRIGSGTRLKILDSMAMGKAIVSTRVGCEGLNVTDGKDIFIGDTPEDFADRVVHLLNNPKQRELLQKNARDLARTYDWEKIEEKQEAVYRQAIYNYQQKKKG